MLTIEIIIVIIAGICYFAIGFILMRAAQFVSGMSDCLTNSVLNAFGLNSMGRSRWEEVMEFLNYAFIFFFWPIDLAIRVLKAIWRFIQEVPWYVRDIKDRVIDYFV